MAALGLAHSMKDLDDRNAKPTSYFTGNPTRHPEVAVKQIVVEVARPRIEHPLAQEIEGAIDEKPLLAEDEVERTRGFDSQRGAIDRLRANDNFSHGTLSVGLRARWSGRDQMK